MIVSVGGFDSILEELYLVFGKAAIERGYSFLAYEGPGQGEPLRRYGLTFTPEWERPTRAVMDEFLRTHPKPGKMVLIGMSMGGYLGARAAAFDERFDGLVSYDTCFDVGEAACRVLDLADDPVLSKSPDFVWSYNNARWTMGTKTPEQTRAAFGPYTLAPVAERIRQHVLILVGGEDHFIPAHQTPDLQAALVNARSVTVKIFDRASGGAEHCQVGSLSLVHATTFNWLLTTFGLSALKRHTFLTLFVAACRRRYAVDDIVGVGPVIESLRQIIRRNTRIESVITAEVSRTQVSIIGPTPNNEILISPASTGKPRSK